MLKLITPIQYESALDGLNQVRPLSLADRGKITLDIPICNSNPVNAGRPALGKLLRCNQRGAILTNGRLGYDDYYYSTGSLSHATLTVKITFPTAVKGFIAKYAEALGTGYIARMDSTYTIQVGKLSLNDYSYFNIRGRYVYLKGFGSIPFVFPYYVYGFY